jgi:transcriptional regulator with XRE-family HTH domain
MSLPIRGLLKCGMAKRNAPASREIFLGEWLKREGLGPTEAAKIAGCSQSYISNISSGARSNINALFLLRLSEHLKININDFFQRPPPESQIAPLRSFSPEAREALLRPKKQKRG